MHALHSLRILSADIKGTPVKPEVWKSALISAALSCSASVLFTVALNAAIMVFSSSRSGGLSTDALVSTALALLTILAKPCYDAVLRYFRGEEQPNTLPPPEPKRRRFPSTLEAMTARKDEYKRVYLAERDIRIRYSFDGILISSAILATLAIAMAGAAQALSIYAAFPGGTAGKVIPWYLNLMQSIVVGPCVAFLGFLQGRFWAPRISEGVTVVRAARACFFGAAFSAVMFLFHLGPELIGLIANARYTVNIPGTETEIPWEYWVAFQRLVYIPSLAAAGFIVGYTGSIQDQSHAGRWH